MRDFFSRNDLESQKDAMVSTQATPSKMYAESPAVARPDRGPQQSSTNYDGSPLDPGLPEPFHLVIFSPTFSAYIGSRRTLPEANRRRSDVLALGPGQQTT
jgi:hypothetical protein